MSALFFALSHCYTHGTVVGTIETMEGQIELMPKPCAMSHGCRVVCNWFHVKDETLGQIEEAINSEHAELSGRKD